MNHEIIADTCYFLHPRTVLFAILVKAEHIHEEKAIIEAKEWNSMLISFKNTGRPRVGFNMPVDAVSAWIRSQPYIECHDGACTVDTSKLIGDFNYTEEEREFLDAVIRTMGDRAQYKTYALFCRLNIDSRLLSDRGTASLLHLRFLNIDRSQLETPKTLDFKPCDDQGNK